MALQSAYIRWCMKGGSVTAVHVQPCSLEPCAIRRGETARINIAFTSNQYTRSVATGISAVLGDQLELPLPSADRDGCRGKGLRCPLRKGANYVFSYDLEVKPIYPKLNTTAKFTLTGERGTVVCALVPVRIVD